MSELAGNAGSGRHLFSIRQPCHSLHPTELRERQRKDRKIPVAGC